MFIKLRTLITTELGHYYALPEDLRRFLMSYFFYLVAYPLMATFTNAYLWRQGESLNLLVTYNLMWCVGLPLGFYLNGYLLKYAHVLRLYLIGFILQGLGGVLVVFAPAESLYQLAAYGLVYGLGAGLFWANKNYLSLRLTAGRNRLYYNSIETTGDLLLNIITPAAIGGFIAFGEKTGLYLPQSAYQILMGVGMTMVTIGGLLVQKSKISDTDHEKMFIQNASPIWNQARLYNIATNFVVGSEQIVPAVLVLLLVGKEGTLGILGSMTALLSAMMMYVIGRKLQLKHAGKVVTFSIVLYLFSTALLAVFFNNFAVLLFMTLSTIIWSLYWTPSSALVMEIIDRLTGKGPQYAYICDMEVMFNIGRIFGIAVLFITMTYFGQNTALRYVPITLGALQLLALIPLHKLVAIVK